MHESLTFHMQDSGQYSISTEEASGLQLKLLLKQLRKSYVDSGNVINMTEQATMSENVSENDLNLCNSAKGWKKNHARWAWPETRIFIKMDSACRNQQGNCNEVENSARLYSLFF